MTKTRSHLYIFKKILTHYCFKSLPSIYRSWIDRVDFLHFLAKIKFASAQQALSPLFLLPGATSPPVGVATSSCCVALTSHGAKTSSPPSLHLLATLRPIASLLSRNQNIESTPPPSTSLHCYKKVISTLATLHTTQLCLYFTFSLIRASCHQSSTHHRHSLSPSFHAHRSSAQ
jgi:hypothetical protein